MSIFTKVDAALPVTTQVLQTNVEVFNLDEMLVFWRRCVALELLSRHRLKGLSWTETVDGKQVDLFTLPHWKAVSMLENNTDVTDKSFYEGWLPRVAQERGRHVQSFAAGALWGACESVSLIMRRLADEGVVDMALFRTLQAMAMPVYVNTSAIHGTDLVPLDALVFGEWDKIPMPLDFIAVELERSLKALQSRQVMLVRCPECEHLYLRQNARAVYCSSRCSSRVRSRRYQKNFFDFTGKNSDNQEGNPSINREMVVI